MRRVLAVVIVLGAAFLVVGCDDGAGEPEAGEPETSIEVPLGEVRVESVGESVELPDEIVDAVMDGVLAYVTDGVVATLRTGEPEDLGAVFDDAALASLDTDEGAGMLDRGAPRATGSLRAEAAPVDLVALAEADGTIVLVAATLDLEVEAEADEGVLSIHRVGELTFGPEGFDWFVTAFRMGVEREGTAVEATDAEAGS